ncbi:hypothetical protein GGI35DRAFT_387763 [Trichoderma velutinum]
MRLMRQNGTPLPGSVAVLRIGLARFDQMSLALRFGSFLLFLLFVCFLLLLLLLLPLFCWTLCPPFRLNGCSRVPNLTVNHFRLFSLALLCSSAKFLRSSPGLRPCAAPDSIRSPQSQAISYQFAGPHGSPRGNRIAETQQISLPNTLNVVVGLFWGSNVRLNLFVGSIQLP